MVLANALRKEENRGINAAFMSNHRGQVCIAFSDPIYARADSILLDPDTRALHVVMHGRSYLISTVSEPMCRCFENNDHALLTAIRPDGSLLELEAPIQVAGAG